MDGLSNKEANLSKFTLFVCRFAMDSSPPSDGCELPFKYGQSIAIAAGQLAVEGARVRYFSREGTFDVDDEVAKYAEPLDSDM